MGKLANFKKFNENGVYWGVVAAGILPLCKETGRLLVCHRSIYVHEPGTWGIFGGKVDFDNPSENDIMDAALRELEEETEYTGQMELIPAYVFKDEDKFSYHNFIGLVDEEFKPILNWENDKYRWMTFEDLDNLNKKHYGLVKLLANSTDLIKKYLD
jgi:8-oxo-dGTP pyrophosphatase MutT (NUDIX family)